MTDSAIDEFFIPNKDSDPAGCAAVLSPLSDSSECSTVCANRDFLRAIAREDRARFVECAGQAGEILIRAAHAAAVAFVCELAGSLREWHNASQSAPALNSHALSDADRQRLDELHWRLMELRPFNIGYPCNQAYDISELFRFLHFSANNVGDPFGGTNYRLNTHEFEREVLADFARFTRAPENEWWGYVTNGGTEGNMYGLYVARELYPRGHLLLQRGHALLRGESPAPPAHAEHHDEEPAGRADGLC